MEKKKERKEKKKKIVPATRKADTPPRLKVTLPIHVRSVTVDKLGSESHKDICDLMLHYNTFKTDSSASLMNLAQCAYSLS